MKVKKPSLRDLFAAHSGKVSDKWDIYISEYDRLFQSYRDQPVRLLEIGIQNGGSLEVWSKYFPKAIKLVGCDIDPACEQLQFDDARISVVVANANSDEAEQEVLTLSTNFDIIIDDGSHQSGDIVRSFARYFSHINNGGLFIAEDLHCSYWQNFEGGLEHPYSSVSFFKSLTDTINHEHWGIDKARGELLHGFNQQYKIELDELILAHVHSIEFINSMCIIKKASPVNNSLGNRFIAGVTAEVDGSPLNLHGSSCTRTNQSQNPWSTNITSNEDRLASQTNEISALNAAATALNAEVNSLRQVTVENDRVHLNALAEINEQVNSQKVTITELKKTFSEQLLTLQQSHEQQKTAQGQLHAKQELAYTAQLDEARQKIQTQLSQLAEREKTFSEQLLTLQQSHEQQKTAQGQLHAKQELAYTAQLDEARQKIQTQLSQLAEREKTFSEQLLTLQQSYEIKITNQQQHNERVRLLETKIDESLSKTLTLMTSEKYYWHTINELDLELEKTYNSRSWRWTALFRAPIPFLMKNKSTDLSNSVGRRQLLLQEDLTKLTIKFNETEPVLYQSSSIANTEPQEVTSNHTTILGTRIEDLLAHYDENFLHIAYQNILGRAVDPEGLQYYLKRIRHGVSKLEILCQLRLSEEGKSKQLSVVGLDEAISSYKYRKSWLHTALNKVGMTGSNKETERKLRVIENTIYLNDSKLQIKLSEISQSLAQIKQQLNFEDARLAEVLEKATDTRELLISSIDEIKLENNAPDGDLRSIENQKNKNSRIACVIPFYNGSKFIERALISIFKQTVPADEIIVVNDGSREDELAYLAALSQKYSFKILSKKNGGQGSARNAGVLASTSEYICFLDQDDFYLPNHNEILLKGIPPKDIDFGWVYADLKEADGEGLIVRMSMVKEHSVHPKHSLIDLMRNDMFVLPSASLINARAYKSVGGFDEQFTGYEDDDLFMRLFRAGWNNYFIDKPVTVWCIHGESTSYSVKMSRSRFKYLKKLISTYPDDPVRARYYFRDLIIPRFGGLIISDATAAKNTDSKDKGELFDILSQYYELARTKPGVPVEYLSGLTNVVNDILGNR
jgi:glycosyltransferase involved in cell wall biosynthesis